MDERMYCRGAMWGTIVGLLVGCLMIAGCGKTEKDRAIVTTPVAVHVQNGASLLSALQQGAVIETRQTAYGTEVVRVNDWIATKGTQKDDGFVVLVNGTVPGFAIDAYPLFAGTHKVEVRFVPYGKRGEEGTPILPLIVEVQ
ncbi:MAG: hypothetical protein Q7S16_04600 [bacterium]|nr:hypothetical protein [bacterium]